MHYVDFACVRRITSKRWSTALILLLLTLTGCGGATTRPIQNKPPKPKPNPDHSITGTWNQSFANNSACSTTVTTSCISGFNEGYLNGATQVQLHNDAASVCTGTTQPESCTSTFNGLLPIGSITFYIATTFVDQNGVAGVTSIATSAPVQVGADPAVNFKVVVQ